MPSQINRIPLFVRFDVASGTNARELITGIPKVPRGNDVELNLGFFYRQAPLDCSNIATVRIEIVDGNLPTSPRLLVKTLNAADITTKILNEAQFSAGTSFNAQTTFTSAEMNPDLSGATAKAYNLILTGTTNTGTRVYFGACQFQVFEDGTDSGAAAPPTVTPPTYFTAAEVTGFLNSRAFQFLPGVNSITGGIAGCLDAIATIGSDNLLICPIGASGANPGTIRFFQERNRGTLVIDGATVIQPSNYNAGANDRVFVDIFANLDVRMQLLAGTTAALNAAVAGNAELAVEQNGDGSFYLRLGDGVRFNRIPILITQNSAFGPDSNSIVIGCGSAAAAGSDQSLMLGFGARLGADFGMAVGHFNALLGDSVTFGHNILAVGVGDVISDLSAGSNATMPVTDAYNSGVRWLVSASAGAGVARTLTIDSSLQVSADTNAANTFAVGDTVLAVDSAIATSNQTAGAPVSYLVTVTAVTANTVTLTGFPAGLNNAAITGFILLNQMALVGLHPRITSLNTRNAVGAFGCNTKKEFALAGEATGPGAVAVTGDATDPSPSNTIRLIPGALMELTFRIVSQAEKTAAPAYFTTTRRVTVARTLAGATNVLNSQTIGADFATAGLAPAINFSVGATYKDLQLTIAMTGTPAGTTWHHCAHVSAIELDRLQAS